MSPTGPPHNGAVLRASNALILMLQGAGNSGHQGSVVLDDMISRSPTSVCSVPKMTSIDSPCNAPGHSPDH